MSNDKEMSEKDKVTHAKEEIQKAEGNEENIEITKNSSSVDPARDETPIDTVNLKDSQEPDPVESVSSGDAETVATIEEKSGKLPSENNPQTPEYNAKVTSVVEDESDITAADNKAVVEESKKPLLTATTEASNQKQIEEGTIEVSGTDSIEVTSDVENISTEALPDAKEDSQQEDENDEHPEIEEDSHIDYSNFSKKKLLSAFKEILSTESFLKNEANLLEIKTHFEEIFNHEKEEALNTFVSNGGNADDFEYRPTDEDKAMFVVFNDFRERKSILFREQERQKEKNLFAKNQILDKLRELVDGEETTHSINTIKQIQDEWKKIGPVPGSQNRNLWASYNALMDRFYDNRSIYFELKELDRKKNLEQKLEICEKAEALFEVQDLKEAIKSLNDLHEEFKHIGPVPRDEQESLWNRFKAASDAVYSRRKEYYENQRGSLIENLEKKEGLIKKLETFKDFKASKIKDWNVKTKEVLVLQKDWEAVGPVPRESGKEINKQFWGLFKQFFQNKNNFFKELDEIRLANKIKAEELIEKATALQESTDWQQTASQMISLQQEWKKIGPTPEKVRDELYKRFKTACDTFFENRRNSTKQVNKEFDENLKLKEAICKKIIEESKGSELSETALEALISQFNAIGFVPRKSMKEILAKFNEAVDIYVKSMGIDGGDKEEFLFRLNLNKLQTDPNSNRVLNKKEHGIRKQISDLENNITLWKNNLEFFASSKTADKLKDQFDEKIQKAEREVEKLKKKLTIIREF